MEQTTIKPNTRASIAQDQTEKVRPRYLTTQQLASLLQQHPYVIGRSYGAAVVGRRASRQSNKLYCPDKIAAILSEQNGFVIPTHVLYELLTPEEALKLLAELGVQRSKSSLVHWRNISVGPAAIKMGGRCRYVASQVRSWGEHLKTSPRPRLPRGESPQQDNVAVPPQRSPRGHPRSRGERGGSLLFSLSSKGHE